MTDFSNFQIPSNISIKDTLKKMDQLGEKTLLITDSDNQLLGLVTDGDIRRWILDDGDLYEEISKVMNTSPIFVNAAHNIEEVKKIMQQKHIECVPVCDNDRKLVNVILWYDCFEKKKQPKQQLDIPVVIMAGGKGTRLQPFTNILPKPLIPIGEKPIIELIIDNFSDYGCNDFYLSVNYKANMIRAFFNDFTHGYSVKYIQEDTPLGTAGSLSLMKERISSTFFISNCDIFIQGNYADMYAYHKDNGNKITIIASLKHYQIPYGILEMGSGGALEHVIEKPEYDFYVNTGMYIMEPEVIDQVPEDSFFLMTDLINNLREDKQKIGVYPVSEKSWLDMGQLEELQEVYERFGVK